MNATCVSIARAIIAMPDWLSALGILFAAACFGASVMCIYYEIRYRRGITHQHREDEIREAFRTNERSQS